MEWETDRIFFVFKITGFEKGTANSHKTEQDTCNGQSMC